MMKNYRPRNNTTTAYTSLSEACAALGSKQKDKNPEESLQQKIEKFQKKHRCRACGKPLTYLGGNVMTCTNDKCKGIKIETEDLDGNKHINYVTSYELLDDVGKSIAEKLFG